ncbi:MAG TPA: FtsH protease activity modulator HflK [Hyphomicrobiaceae bacterium]|nr:FtsH protease activity modulator HflK [Hyphomicrobiaceae bacterium]
MPWSNQSGNGNGWKGSGGGGGPWGGGSGGGQQPDLEEFLRRGQDRLKKAIPGGGPPGLLVLLIGLVAAVFVGFFAFTFRVDQDEVGVVTRFGKYDREAPPGLHFRLPAPIEEVRTPKVTRQNLTEVGFRSGGTGRVASSGANRDVPEESVMLTGDQNIVDVDFVIYWRIKDAKLYLFNIQNPDGTVKEVAESAMREVIGKADIQPILTEARQATSKAVHELMQTILDNYKAGITIDEVRLLKVAPPAQVADAFLDVQAARADRDRLQNEAEAYKNRIIPEAEGEAKRIEKEADAFREQTIAEAIGQTKRFLSVYEEYRKSPDVTRRRIYLETMERILSGSDKIILDSRGGPSPILPLDMFRRKGN